MIISAEQIEKIQEKAHQLGFVACGLTPLHPFVKEKTQFLKWLQNRHHGEMEFLERNIEKRFNPSSLDKNFRSAIVVLINYYSKENPVKNQIPKVSKYALGKDYHTVVKDRLCVLQQFINNEIAPMTGRCFVDSAPVYETQLAIDAGLGWKGKNTLLINKQYGSFVFIGEILSDLEVPENTTVEPNHCGNCTRCIDACPTGALQPDFLDATKCISYLTIERKSLQPSKYKTSPWIYGCDICQDVCPWNSNTQPTKIEEFSPKPFLLSAGIPEWEKLSAAEFDKIFADSPILRTGFKRMKRNLNEITKP